MLDIVGATDFSEKLSRRLGIYVGTISTKRAANIIFLSIAAKSIPAISCAPIGSIMTAEMQ